MNEYYEDAAYDDAFFDQQEQTVLDSARVVVPLLLRLITPARVIDVGSGRGAWLRVFREHGVTTIRGVDGAYVNPERLLIDRSCFTPCDLSRPFELEGRYDLACCLETAEHLPYALGPHLVRNLVRLAPLVLFSAAIPGQGGNGHINEQWPPYWRKQFAEHKYVRLDPLRPLVRHDQRVAWWYRQNLFLFASEEAVARSPALQAEAKNADTEFELVHVNAMYGLNEIYRYRSLRGILCELPRAAWRALRRKLGRNRLYAF